eukprot:EG_transcript_17819
MSCMGLALAASKDGVEPPLPSPTSIVTLLCAVGPFALCLALSATAAVWLVAGPPTLGSGVTAVAREPGPRRPVPHLPRRAALATAAVPVFLRRPAVAQEPAAPPDAAPYVAEDGRFRCVAPAGWSLAYDRSRGMRDPGVVAVFVNAATTGTFSVRRATGKQLGLDLSGTPDLALLVRSVFEEAAAQPRVVDVQRVAGDPGAAEYVVRQCLGRVEEGRGGAVRCVEGPEDEIPLTVRHHYARVLPGPAGAAGERPVYIAMGSAAEERWPEAAAAVRALVDSFELAAGPVRST